ncbi:MAG: hypothetical protein ABEK17_00960 [Candidatus Aenigmatarchaeota archaeon]
MERSELLKGIVVGLIMGLTVFLIYNFALTGNISKEEAGEKLKEIYTLSNPNQNIQISSVTEEHGLYKVIVKSDNRLHEVYTTKNGEVFIRNPSQIDKLHSRLRETQDFIDCLEEKDVRLYGIVNQTATQAQIQILGGTTFASQLYTSCGGQNVERCTEQGIERVPSIKIGDQVMTGVKTVPQIENATGCTFKG